MMHFICFLIFVATIVSQSSSSCPSCTCSSNSDGLTADRFSYCLLYKPSECAMIVNGTVNTTLQCYYLDKYCRCLNYMTQYGFFSMDEECTFSCQSYGCNYDCSSFYTGSWTPYGDNAGTSIHYFNPVFTIIIIIFLIYFEKLKKI